MKIRAKFVNGSWTNDDIDLIPTIKLRTGSKTNSQLGMTVTATSIAFCWLKWGIMVSAGVVKNLNTSPKLVVKSKKGPTSEPIVFNSIEEGIKYFMYPQYIDLPSPISTKGEFKQVLNYFLLPEHYELHVVNGSSVDYMISITIVFKQPLLTHRIEQAKEYINKHKSVYIQVEYR